MGNGGKRASFFLSFPLLCLYIYTYIRSQRRQLLPITQCRNPSIHPCTYLHTYLPGTHNPPQPSLPFFTFQFSPIIEFTKASKYTHSTMYSPAYCSKPQGIQTHTFVFSPFPLLTHERERERGGEGGAGNCQEGRDARSGFLSAFGKGKKMRRTSAY